MKNKSNPEYDHLVQRLKDCREMTINDPAIQYTVGQRVRRGYIDKSVITEVLDNGKILKLHENLAATSREKASERDDYVPWHDVIPYTTTFPNQIYNNDDIQMQFSHQCIDSLFSIYYHFGCEMNQDYQRGNVWSESDEINLINSIFNNVEIGKFAFIHRSWEESGAINQPSYEILDGKQRLTALIRFYENRFQYKGLFFYQMCPKDQYHFTDYPVMTSKIENMTQKQKYQYFLKLNVSGHPQDPKHIEYVQKLYSEI